MIKLLKKPVIATPVLTLAWQSAISVSLCEGGVSYGGIAAENGAKNMPPACFLNAPTEGEN